MGMFVLEKGFVCIKMLLKSEKNAHFLQNIWSIQIKAVPLQPISCLFDRINIKCEISIYQNYYRMKKYLLIIAVVAFAFAACKPKPVPEKEVTFQITVTDIAASTASVKVIPSDSNALYYYDVISVEYYEELKSEEALATELKEYWEEVIAYYKEQGETITIEDFLSKGNDGWDYTGLTPNTQYYAYAFCLDSTYALKGKISKVAFATEEVQNVNLLFEPAMSDTAIWFLPNNDDVDYLPFVVDADSLNGYSVAEYYDLYAEYLQAGYGEYFEYYCLMYGPVYVKFNELEAGHSYYFAAKAYTDGVWNSDLFQTQFSVPSVPNAPAKINKGGFNKQARMKKAKKVEPVKGDFKNAKMAK